MREEPGDDELEEELRILAAWLEPVPPDVIASAVSAYTWRTVDAELAELVYDSMLDEDAATLVRGGTERLVTFRSGELTIDVEVAVMGPLRNLTGRIVPARRAGVTIKHREGAVTTDADELGRFRVEHVPAGPVSLQLLVADPAQPSIATDWVTI
jgi:hypothetical protein